MDPRIAALADILRLNTKLFRNCLDGLTDERANRRPSATVNSAAFVAVHVTDARFMILRAVGASRPSPFPSLAAVRGIEEVSGLPPLAEVQAAWTEASRALRDRLESISAAELDAPAPAGLPGPAQSVLGILTFLVQHDSYHIGQLALLRKHAGLPAMSYR
jgi:uncharacterized damage-inducible protein DinB